MQSPVFLSCHFFNNLSDHFSNLKSFYEELNNFKKFILESKCISVIMIKVCDAVIYNQFKQEHKSVF